MTLNQSGPGVPVFDTADRCGVDPESFSDFRHRDVQVEEFPDLTNVLRSQDGAIDDVVRERGMRLQVVDVDAIFLTTAMVNLITIRNRAVLALEVDDVGVLRFSSTADGPVPSRGLRSLPDVTRRLESPVLDDVVHGRLIPVMPTDVPLGLTFDRSLPSHGYASDRSRLATPAFTELHRLPPSETSVASSIQDVKSWRYGRYA
jgi:hypothetical protein